MLQGWKGLLVVLPLDTTHASLSVRCAELPCNCFGLFCVNEEHIQLGLHRTASQNCAVCTCQSTDGNRCRRACTRCRLRHIFAHYFILFFARCHIVLTVHPHVMSLLLLFTHTHMDTCGHILLLTNDFLIPGQYPLCEADVRRRRG